MSVAVRVAGRRRFRPPPPSALPSAVRTFELNMAPARSGQDPFWRRGFPCQSETSGTSLPTARAGPSGLKVQGFCARQFQRILPLSAGRKRHVRAFFRRPLKFHWVVEYRISDVRGAKSSGPPAWLAGKRPNAIEAGKRLESFLAAGFAKIRTSLRRQRSNRQEDACVVPIFPPLFPRNRFQGITQ